MLAPHFCNYNVEYQRRLGFLKLLAWAAEGARGGTEQIQARIHAVYPPTRKIPATRKRTQSFDPKGLLELPENLSWLPGFTPNGLEKLFYWADMTGLLKHGRLTEWARVLLLLKNPEDPEKWQERNPFILTLQERAFFLHLLLFHDQLLAELLTLLSRIPGNRKLMMHDGRRMITEALGTMFERTTGTGVQAMKVRQTLRGLLEKIARDYGLPKGVLFQRDSRLAALASAKPPPGKQHVAANQALCRLEQLVDLRMLIKEDPSNPPANDEVRREARTSWVWFVPDQLRRAAPNLESRVIDLESLLEEHWIALCGAVWELNLKTLDTFEDQLEIAHLLDSTLPLARRQIGATQVHTWAILTSIQAMKLGKRLELGTIFRLLDAMRTAPGYGECIRLSGQQTYLGRTAFLVEGRMAHFVQNHRLS